MEKRLISVLGLLEAHVKIMITYIRYFVMQRQDKSFVCSMLNPSYHE